MAVAVFLGRGELGVNETVVSAMIIVITFHSSGSATEALLSRTS